MTNHPFMVASTGQRHRARRMAVWGHGLVTCEVQWISVCNIVATQENVDQVHVRRLVDSPYGATHWPPILVMRSRNRFLVVDGHHRAVAAQRLGREYISAVVVREKRLGRAQK